MRRSRTREENNRPRLDRWPARSSTIMILTVVALTAVAVVIMGIVLKRGAK